MGQESERVSAASGVEKAGKKRKKEEHESCRNIGRGMYSALAKKQSDLSVNTDLPGRYNNYLLYICVCMCTCIYVCKAVHVCAHTYDGRHNVDLCTCTVY